jgi:hypothetical protein
MRPTTRSFAINVLNMFTIGGSDLGYG